MISRLKKLTAVFLAALAISFSGCSSGKNLDLYPVEKETRAEESSNTLGARFTFTLKQFTELMNENLKAMSPNADTAQLDFDRWRMLTDQMKDDNQVALSTFGYQMGEVTLEAAIEDDNEKMINVACSCPFDDFYDEEKDLKDPVLTYAALTAVVAGGYEQTAIDFFFELYSKMLDEGKHALYFHNMVCGAAQDSQNTVMFFVNAIDEEIAREREIEFFT